MNRSRRHIFPDGTIVYFRPSVIGPVYPEFQTALTNIGDVLVKDMRCIGYAFPYVIDGRVLTARFGTEELAKFERNRLVKFAGSESLPPEMHLT